MGPIAQNLELWTSVNTATVKAHEKHTWSVQHYDTLLNVNIQTRIILLIAVGHANSLFYYYILKEDFFRIRIGCYL